MDFRPMAVEERETLMKALRGNAEKDEPLLMSRKDTSFLSVVDDEDEVMAVRSIPCHY